MMLFNVVCVLKAFVRSGRPGLIASLCGCGYSRGKKTLPRKIPEKEKKYTNTVLLPKTQFPLRINPSKRVEMDSYIYNECKFSKLYEWQRKNMKGKEFILHDGPPYANGKLHMGHAVNKILKDITNRHKLLQGYKIHYVPGWDCHGLPIELKAIINDGDYMRENEAIEIRKKARNFAGEAIEAQMKVFQSLGIMTNWNDCYFTLSKEYIKNQLNQFYELYRKGLVYRDMKPVFWSPTSRSALAEAELEYNPSHVSKSVIVGVSVINLPDALKSFACPSQVQALIWTTTPWTLPANQAICYNPNISYCMASVCGSEDLYLLATQTVDTIQTKIEKKLEILETFSGDLLRNIQYCHPMESNKHLSFLPGTHVSLDKGTGLVHTAPAHGPDDFLVALQHQMPVLSLVDEDGCYTVEAGPDLRGLPVLDEGSTKVLDMVKSRIVYSEDYVHSYPYDWRAKKPVLLRACQQWFIDTNAIKNKAVELLQAIDVYPQKLQNQNSFTSQLEKRPYWCISRQRVWGVPIPVLYKETDESPVITRELVDHYNDLLDKHGPDFWWTLAKEDLAPDHLLEAQGLKTNTIRKGKDILDIWFDSGLSWSYVLGNDRVADLFLEGTDQITGWFQSSLLTSTALCGKSPFRSIFVHGFAVDEKGYKMSKSVGNVVNPQDITHGGKDIKKQPALGVDTLRWWVASHASQHVNVPVSSNILEASASEVQKIRIVLRFLLGSLWDYTNTDNSPSLKNFHSLDLWMLNKLQIFEKEIFESYNGFQYNNVCRIITNFVTNEVSSIYCHMIKDRLYCSKGNNVHRLSCQFVMKHMLETISQAAAPILPFLAEEVYLHHPCKDGEHLFFSEVKNIPQDWHFSDATAAVNCALKVKEKLNKESSKNTMELHANVYATGKDLMILKKLSEQAELNELLQVSSSEVLEGTSSEVQVEVRPSLGKQCDRCRQYTAHDEFHLCHRCEEVLREMSFSNVE